MHMLVSSVMMTHSKKEGEPDMGKVLDAAIHEVLAVSNVKFTQNED